MWWCLVRTCSARWQDSSSNRGIPPPKREFSDELLSGGFFFSLYPTPALAY